mmetsp:Transcript_3103/g.7599  ORF Transcript_3103/g.7599 Transcript_3103/m.7599 type:complete len:93 (-) Transcript_3103:248-526(-)
MGFDQRLSIVIQVLGLVKQLEIQGSGDAFILLKDPTGTVGGSVHSEVFEIENSFKEGSVVVLEHVSVFSPDERQYFLCITVDSLVQVFPPTD